MVSVTPDETLQTLLASLKSLTEIRNTAGQLIGYFAPAPDRDKLLYQQAAEHFDHDEIRRRKESRDNDYALDDVLKHLESLENG